MNNINQHQRELCSRKLQESTKVVFIHNSKTDIEGPCESSEFLNIF